MSDAHPQAGPLSPIVPANGETVWDELSPDGRTLVRWQLSDGRMSHVIVTPTLCDATTEVPVLALDSGFDGQIGWQDAGRFTLHLRHYWRGDAGLTVEIDRPAGRFRLADSQVDHPISELSPAIEAHFSTSANAAGQEVGHSPPKRRALPLVAGLLALGGVGGLWLALR